MGSAQPLAPQASSAAGSFQLEVAEVIEETADARSLVLRVPAQLAERFAYQAGQFLGFRVSVAGKRLPVSYTHLTLPTSDLV